MSLQFDTSRYVRDAPISPFYSHPHSPHVQNLLRPDFYSHLTRFDEDLWNSRLAERKMMERYQEEKYYQRISSPKSLDENRPPEIDLTTTGHRNQIGEYVRHSPMYYHNSVADKEKDSDTEYSRTSVSVSPPGLDDRVRKSQFYYPHALQVS